MSQRSMAIVLTKMEINGTFAIVSIENQDWYNTDVSVNKLTPSYFSLLNSKKYTAQGDELFLTYSLTSF